LFDRLQGELIAREKSPGLSLDDVMALPDPLDRLSMWMMRRRQVSLGDVTGFLEQDEQRARQCLDYLLDQGFIREVVIGEAMVYKVRLAPTRKRKIPLDLWQALLEKVEE
jgi:hypothetical protein